MTLFLLKHKHHKLYQYATYAVVIGLLIMIISPNFLERGSVAHLICTITGFVLILNRLLLPFTFPRSSVIGKITFKNDHFFIKIDQEKSQKYSLEEIQFFNYEIVNYEGQTSGKDLLTGYIGMFRMREGDSNKISFTHQGTEYQYIFKLSNYHQYKVSKKLLAAYMTPVQHS